MGHLTRFLIGIIASLAISGPALAQSQMTGPASIPVETAIKLHGLHVMAWNTACELKKQQKLCAQWVMPKVAYGLLFGDYGAYRHGSDIALVDLRLIGQEFGHVVLIHEMIHYIQHLENPLVVNLLAANACAEEEEAFTLVYEYVQKSEIAKGDPRVETWSQALPKYAFCPQEKK